MNRKRLILLVLIIGLVFAVVRGVMTVPQQKTVSTLKYQPGQTAQTVRPRIDTGTPSAVSGDDRKLRLDLLEAEHTSFKGYRRNIFKPVFVDEQKLLKQKASAVKPIALPPPVLQKPAAPPTLQVDTQAEQPQRDLANFTFLGFLKKDNRKTIFLAKDKDIILVRSGETFGGGKYEATAITDQALTIQVTGSGDEIVIPLIESRPLAAAR